MLWDVSRLVFLSRLLIGPVVSVHRALVDVVHLQEEVELHVLVGERVASDTAIDGLVCVC